MIENDTIYKSNNEEDKKIIRNGNEKKCPYDMKLFWKSINDKFFKTIEESHISELNHLILYHSSYDLQNDLIYSKIGFPRNFNSFVGKQNQEVNSKKNNPEFVNKLFGMNLYIDKYDYIENNLGNDDLQTEINCIDGKLKQIEENNHFFFNNLRQKLKEENFCSLNNLDNLETKKIRLMNISLQIYNLQMRQIAECISSIKKDKENNKYVVIFDKSEDLATNILDEKHYKGLIKLRDTMNTISIYDLFQEKIKSTYSNSISKTRGTSNKSQKNSNINSKKNSVQIAKNFTVNNELCHHCKQKKPTEIMLKCQSENVEKPIEKILKHFIINNNTVVKKNKNHHATVYLGDPKEIIENYLNKSPKSKNDSCSTNSKCNRYYCYFCLKGSYDIVSDQIASKKEWACPYCLSQCFCTRCSRYDQVIKLVALYLSLEGNIQTLVDFLVKKNPILANLKSNLIISKIFIVNVQKAEKKPLKTTTYGVKKFGKLSKEKINQYLKELIQKKTELEDKKTQINELFLKSYQEKVQINIETKYKDIDQKLFNNFLLFPDPNPFKMTFLERKTKRQEKISSSSTSTENTQTIKKRTYRKNKEFSMKARILRRVNKPRTRRTRFNKNTKYT